MKQMIQKIKKENKRKYYMLKTAVFILLFFAVDFIIGFAFHKLYLKQKSGWEYRTKYSIEDTKADMILVGSSRAQQQYNPEFFETRLNMTCYNAGRDGQSFLYQYAVLQGILKRYSPKTILIECERKMFMPNPGSYERLSCLLPFYQDHPEMREVILLKSPYEKIKLLSKSYPYNSLFFKILIANVSKKPDEDIKGYVPLKGSLNEKKRFVDFSVPYDIDSIKLKYFSLLVEQCQKANIKLYFACSPYYINSYGSDASLRIVKKIADKESIPFFDLSKGVPELNDSRLYDDTVHVNQAGSKILANIVIDSILNSGK